MFMCVLLYVGVLVHVYCVYAGVFVHVHCMYVYMYVCRLQV